MARKPKTQIPAAPQSDIAFAQLLLITMQIYGSNKHHSRGARKAH